jgi:hypothetical protein
MLQPGGGRRRLRLGREADGRVPGRGRSLIGALHGFLRPGDSGPGPAGGPPNSYPDTAPGTRDDLGVHMTPSFTTDATRHCRKWKWVRMRPPFPHPITDGGPRKDLVVIRPTLSLLGGEGGTVTGREGGRVTGGEGGGGKAESPSARGGGRTRRVRVETAQCEWGKAVLPPSFGFRVRRSETRNHALPRASRGSRWDERWLLTITS